MAQGHQPEQPQPDPTGDYGYDMAHDFEPADIPAAGPRHEHPPVYVATESSDTDEDYSYDLAHDVPPQNS